MLPGDTEDDLINDTNQLGEIVNNKFNANLGYKALRRIVDSNNIKLIERVAIRSSDGGMLTIEDFLNTISPLKLIENYGV